jgi:hypothetical protein
VSGMGKRSYRGIRSRIRRRSRQSVLVPTNYARGHERGFDLHPLNGGSSPGIVPNPTAPRHFSQSRRPPEYG